MKNVKKAKTVKNVKKTPAVAEAVKVEKTPEKYANFTLRGLTANSSKRSKLFNFIKGLKVTKESKTYKIKEAIGAEYVADTLTPKIVKDLKTDGQFVKITKLPAGEKKVTSIAVSLAEQTA